MDNAEKLKLADEILAATDQDEGTWYLDNGKGTILINTTQENMAAFKSIITEWKNRYAINCDNCGPRVLEYCPNCGKSFREDKP